MDECVCRLVIGCGRRGIEELSHGREPGRVVRELEVGGSFGGEAFASFIDLSDIAQHEGHRGAQHGDGRVVAGRIDEYVDHLFKSPA